MRAAVVAVGDNSAQRLYKACLHFTILSHPRGPYLGIFVSTGLSNVVGQQGYLLT